MSSCFSPPLLLFIAMRAFYGLSLWITPHLLFTYPDLHHRLLGLWFENENHYTMSLYPTDDKVREDYLSLYRWQWLKHLAEKKVYELHCEIFEYFGKYPGDLHRLHWREFEELLDSGFKTKGFHHGP